MASDTVPTVREQEPAAVRNSSLDPARRRENGITQLQRLFTFTRRQLIAIFVLFNLMFWILVIWAVLH
jgi:hypothetical protein